MQTLSTATLDYLAREQRIKAADSMDDLPSGRPFVPTMRREETADEYHARCLRFAESYRQFAQEEKS